MTPPLTVDEAIDLLRQHPTQYVTPDQLRALAVRLDADSPGRLTVLYSGQAASGLSGNNVIEAMVEAGEDIRAINKSQAAEFLGSRDFYNAVAKAYGLQDARTLMDGTYRGPATDWLYHPTQGPWADVSARFADATAGDVRAIVPDALPSRTFGEVELPLGTADMPKLPLPPIPQRLRELLKDYPEHIQELQRSLNLVVEKPSIGNPPFEVAIWALEDTLSYFIGEARDELEAAEASGDAEAIAKAKEKLDLMFSARSGNIGMKNLEELGQYFDIHGGHFDERPTKWPRRS